MHNVVHAYGLDGAAWVDGLMGWIGIGRVADIGGMVGADWTDWVD